jgi:hypothetical protein
MKTSDLIGKALDQAVGVCKKWDVRVAESGNVYVIAKTSGNIHDCVPSSNWTQGGPIIEQEKIEIKPVYSGWAAYLGNTYFGIGPQEYLETIMQKVPIPELLEEAANIPAQQAPVKESK